MNIENDINPEIKKELIGEIIKKEFTDHKMPEVLFSLGGSIKKDKKNDRYRTLSYSDLSEHELVTGGRTRVIATAEIAKNFPELPIVATSRYFPDEPTMAEVVFRELKERGVTNKILLEKESMSTITQIIEMVKMAQEKGWSRVAAITNDYHTPRMKEMYKQLDRLIDDSKFHGTLKKFKENNGEIAFIGSEEIMTLISGHFKYYLDKVRKSVEYQKTVAAEATGLKDLKEGRYKISKLKEKPKE